MDVTKISNPQVLKKMSMNECTQLAKDIRTFLIHSISKTGGHLSSNLGVVELTIALHRVFDSPKDKIFFDVGHQCYTHKILTGRASQFTTLRSFQGMSGFQKRSESVHDVWEAGHSSTSLSAALGMTVARDLNHEDYCVVPVIGDGALSSGMSLEALNQIGSLSKRMIIIFNDNDMSITQNVGALTSAFSKLRSSTPYTGLKGDIKEALNKSDIGKSVLGGLTSIKDNLKKGIIDAGIFDEFNIDYLGPVDGHNIKKLSRVLETAKHSKGPVVVHVLTKKGHGYAPCENDSQGKWHGVGPFNIKNGELLASLPKGQLSWSAIISETLLDIAKQDERVCAITPAMINGSKLEKFFATFPERSFDCGIAEEHATTFAAGLAISGKRPFISMYSSFLQRAYDQINHDICRMDLPVIIGVDRAGLVGEDGDTHHGVFDIGLLRCLPNMILCQPKDAYEAQSLIYLAMKQSHPFAIRYPRGNVVYEKMQEFEEIKVGSWSMFNFHQDNRVVVLAYGPDVDRILSKVVLNELPITVVNARFFKPLDEEMLNDLVNMKCPLVVYESDMIAGGLSSAMLEWSAKNQLKLNLKVIGIHDEYIEHGSLNQLRQVAKIDLNSLFEELLRY